MATRTHSKTTTDGPTEMTTPLPPIEPPVNVIIPPYIPPYGPTPNITPFTYRDGATYLQILEGLRVYINRTIVPFINENFAEFGQIFADEVNRLIDAVNAAIDMVINDSVEIQDPIVAQLIRDVNSLTRVALDELYVNKTEFAALSDEVGVLETQITATNDRISRYARHVKEFGAVGDGVVDDTAALNTAVASGYALYWGGPADVYSVTAPITTTLTKALVWHGDGATIKVNSVESILNVVKINAEGHDVSIQGPLTIDANTKAFTAWSISNLIPTFCNFTGVGMAARNVHRKDQTMIGGDGIVVRGAFTTVYLQRPDVRNVTMAVGAGISGSQGVCGITVSSAGPGLAAKDVSIISPYVENIYSQDESYLMDQDGIRIFTEEDAGSTTLFETSFKLFGGKIKNCGGRSVKSQCEWGVIDGTMFMRRNTPFAGRTGAMPEIDFQVGGGIISNIELQYVGNAPSRVIQWSGTRQVGGKYAHGITVNGVKLSYSGGQLLDRFFAATLYEQVRAVVNISNVEIVNPANFLQTYFATVQGTEAQETIINLTNIVAPMNVGAPFLQRIALAMPTFASFNNIVNARPGASKFSALTTAGAYTEVIAGNNVRVSS